MMIRVGRGGLYILMFISFSRCKTWLKGKDYAIRKRGTWASSDDC